MWINYALTSYYNTSSANVTDVVAGKSVLKLVLALISLSSSLSFIWGCCKRLPATSTINGGFVCSLTLLRSSSSCASPLRQIVVPLSDLDLRLSVTAAAAAANFLLNTLSQTFSSPGTGGPQRTNCKRSSYIEIIQSFARLLFI